MSKDKLNSLTTSISFSKEFLIYPLLIWSQKVELLRTLLD